MPSNPNGDAPSEDPGGGEALRPLPRVVAVILTLDEALSITRVIEALCDQRRRADPVGSLLTLILAVTLVV